MKEANENIKIYALEPDKMPLLSQNKKYLSTDLSKPINNNKFISNQVELLDYEFI